MEGWYHRALLYNHIENYSINLYDKTHIFEVCFPHLKQYFFKYCIRHGYRGLSEIWFLRKFRRCLLMRSCQSSNARHINLNLYWSGRFKTFPTFLFAFSSRGVAWPFLPGGIFNYWNMDKEPLKGRTFCSFSAQPLYVRSIQMCARKLENSEEEKINKLFPNSSAHLDWFAKSTRIKMWRQFTLKETQVHIREVSKKEALLVVIYY